MITTLIDNDDAHAQALKDIEQLWGAQTGSFRAERLERLVEAVVAYEERRWPEANGT